MSENWKDASEGVVAEFESDSVCVKVAARKNPDADGLQVLAYISWTSDFDPYDEPESELQAAGELLYPYLKRWRTHVHRFRDSPDSRDTLACIDNFIRELKANNLGLM